MDKKLRQSVKNIDRQASSEGLKFSLEFRIFAIVYIVMISVGIRAWLCL